MTKQKMNPQDVRKLLFSLADEKYKKFSSGLFINPPKIIGVRLGELRRIAKTIAKENLNEYLNFNLFYHEEILLAAMAIGSYNSDAKEILVLIEKFIPRITNWAVCDSFCSGLKFTNKNKVLIWDFIKKYSNSKNEFELRFFFVMALNYYIEAQYLDEIFEILTKAGCEKYYAKMAAAWLISQCFAKFPRKTQDFLLNTRLDKTVLQYSIRKINESLKIDTKDKLSLKKLIHQQNQLP